MTREEFEYADSPLVIMLIYDVNQNAVIETRKYQGKGAYSRAIEARDKIYEMHDHVVAVFIDNSEASMEYSDQMIEELENERQSFGGVEFHTDVDD